MSDSKDSGIAATNPVSELTAEDEQKSAVIADIMARVSLSKLRTLEITSTCRAGAFMLSALRRDCRACMIALNDNALIIGERQIGFGPKWYPEGLTRELLSFSSLAGADKILLGTTLNSKWQELLAFNEVYEALRDSGVTLVDIIEVKYGSFTSVFKMFSTDKSPFYKEFQEKRKRRR